MQEQPACRFCRHHSRQGTISTCGLMSRRVRLLHVCELFDYQLESLRSITLEELESVLRFTRGGSEGVPGRPPGR